MPTRTLHPSRQKHPIRIELPDGGVRLIESHHAIDFRMDRDTWPFHKLCWVAEGRGVLEFSSGSKAIERNDFLLLPEELPHRFVDDPGAPLTLVMFCISGKFFEDSGAAPRRSLWRSVVASLVVASPYCARSAYWHGQLESLFREALGEQESKRVGWEMAVAASVDRLLIHFARETCVPREGHSASALQSVQEVVAHLEARPYEAVQITEMADRCGLSRRRFTDIFRQITNESFNHYLNRLRVEYACERLRRTGHILYACHQAGFNDLAYFYRVFRKFTQTTPGAYLNTIAPDDTPSGSG